MKILIIAKSNDNQSVHMVTRALEARGARVLRIDSDRFPTQAGLRLWEGPTETRFQWRTEEKWEDLLDADAVYYRRLMLGSGLQHLDPKYQDASLKEVRATILGMLHTLPAFQLDPYEQIRKAEHKQKQLALAKEVGLEIPRTLTTNDPQGVQDFASRCPEGVICKMLSSFSIPGDKGEEQVVFTNRLDTQALGELESLQWCPMTFQERVPKAKELRVTVVGEQCFAAEVDSQSSTRGQEDWRRDGQHLSHEWRKHDLPEPLQKQIMALMDRLGLNYGALDFILTPDGRYVFLEINPGGEWFWLQLYAPHFPIAEALADVLTHQSPRRGTMSAC